MPRSCAGISDRIHQDRGAIHELVADVLRVHILTEIHDQRAHWRVAF